MESKKETENQDPKIIPDKNNEKIKSNETKEKENKKVKKKNESSKKQNNKEINNEKSLNEEDQIGLWKCWKEHSPIPIPGYPQITLMGWSVAALRTNFYIKELGLMLDAGLSSPTWVINHLLITHCHSDHCANLPFHLYSHKPSEKIKIICS